MITRFLSRVSENLPSIKSNTYLKNLLDIQIAIAIVGDGVSDNNKMRLIRVRGQ